VSTISPRELAHRVRQSTGLRLVRESMVINDARERPDEVGANRDAGQNHNDIDRTRVGAEASALDTFTRNTERVA
jgi:hypothetical protein